jgi:hypothetical protein
MKKILFVIFTISLFNTDILHAQAVDQAYASQHGIFVKLEQDFPAQHHLVAAAYTIKRKAAGEKA